jgi:hypothetical protein
MSTMKESILVDCPMHDIIVLAERYFSAHRRGQEPGTVTLVVDLADLRIPSQVQARHNVHVAYRASRDSDVLKIAWDPQDSMIPKFAGVLHAERSFGFHTTLTLEGRYHPPLGVLGAAFDALVGKRIASATGYALLQDIKAFIESNYKQALATTLASSPKE